MISPDIIGKFINYAKFDEDGDIVGINNDAPESAKKAYKQFVDERKNAKKNGVKI